MIADATENAGTPLAIEHAQTSDCSIEEIQKAEGPTNRLLHAQALWNAFNGQVLESKCVKTDQGWLKLYGLMVDASAQCFWPVTQALFNEYLARTETDRTSAIFRQCLTLQADASMKMGDLEAARTSLMEILFTFPNDSLAFNQYWLLNDWNNLCALRDLHTVVEGENENLMLQPLGFHHADSFLKIYSDDTAYLCRLPVFADVSDWQQWLSDRYDDPMEKIFAVTHKQFGIIGVVSLVLCEQKGFFYYWIGEEFRGRGFGPQAVSLMLNYANEVWGLHTCYAKAFCFNSASLCGLNKLGFELLEIQAAAPNHKEVFFRLGPEIDEISLIEEMRNFYRNIGCERNFLRPIAA